MTDIYNTSQGKQSTNTEVIMASPVFNLFKNLCSYNSKQIGFDELERLIKYDADVKDKSAAYLSMKKAVGKREADAQVKQKELPAVSVQVIFNGAGKQMQHILGFTSLAFSDIDDIDDVDAAFNQVIADPHTLMAYKTVGLEGLRIIYKYVREQPDTHIDSVSWKAAFQKGNNHYATLTGQEYDNQCADYTHLCGLAHDENAYVNKNAVPFVITDEEILKANFDAGFEGGKPRKLYPAGTSTTSVEEAWPKVKAMLEKKNMTFSPGHHHDYVMHASFLFNRFGTDLDELLEWAAEEWSDYNSKQCESTIRSCYKKTDEHGTWKIRKQSQKSERLEIINLPEIEAWLKERYDLKYDDVTDLTYYREKEQDRWVALDEREIRTLRRKIATDTCKRVLKSDVQDVLWSDTSILVHPVRDYLNGLPKWDGTDRVELLASNVIVEPAQAGQDAVEAQHDFTERFHKWMLGNVGMWLNDQVVNHEMLILVGPQGIYKTTFFRYLLPPQLRHLYWENTQNSFRQKDDKIALGENCLVEVEEFSITSPYDIGVMKSLITALSIKERRPYGRQREEKHRLAGFCGTCNDQQFLSDETGNRRFLCFLVSNVRHPSEWGLDYQQFYAQLRDEFRRGDRYWFNREEELQLEKQNDEFRLMSDEEMLVRTYFRKPRGSESGEWMNSANICQYINGGRIGYGLSTKKIGSVLRRLKFKKDHKANGNFYLVVKIPAKQRQAEITSEIDSVEQEQKEPQQTELPF